jgi:hypothetical protein
MNKSNYPDSGLSYLVSLVGSLLKIIGVMIVFPFRVLWHYVNPLNVKRINIEKLNNKR